MPYEYKHIPASVKSLGTKGVNPKNQYVELFQQTLDEQFYNASNWWTIQEETSVGSKEYVDIDVRIAHVINAETGLKLGEDWKTLLFKDVDHPIELGKQYIFDNSTWITVNAEVVKNLTGTCTIRRCNNSLRWIDEETGVFYEEACCIEYLVKEPRNYATAGSPFMTPGGFLHIVAQLNDNSNKINENQRFLFGNVGHWTCYKVIGTGINDFKNTETYNNESAKVLNLDLTADYVNDQLDDVINGIADVNTNVYTLSLNRDFAEGSPLDTIQLFPTITYNGKTVSRDVEWSTSNTKIATVDSTGLVTLKSLGECSITGTLNGNTVSDSCVITVTATPQPNYDILLSPDTNYVLEGSLKEFSVYLYENNIELGASFTITCSPNQVPSANYTFAQTGGNTFTILNRIRDLSSFLTINCVSGSYSKSFNIYLKGGW
jgi:hypothetical protein